MAISYDFAPQSLPLIAVRGEKIFADRRSTPCGRVGRPLLPLSLYPLARIRQPTRSMARKWGS